MLTHHMHTHTHTHIDPNSEPHLGPCLQHQQLLPCGPPRGQHVAAVPEHAPQRRPRPAENLHIRLGEAAHIQHQLGVVPQRGDGAARGRGEHAAKWDDGRAAQVGCQEGGGARQEGQERRQLAAGVLHHMEQLVSLQASGWAAVLRTA